MLRIMTTILKELNTKIKDKAITKYDVYEQFLTDWIQHELIRIAEEFADYLKDEEKIEVEYNDHWDISNTNNLIKKVYHFNSKLSWRIFELQKLTFD